MHSIGDFLKIIFYILLFTVYSLSVSGQDTISVDDKFSSLSFSLDFMSDNNVNGRFSMFGSQPNLAGSASYYHKWGFDISAMYSNVWKSDESNSNATQELGLSLGYNLDMTKWLSASASYSHFYYSRNSNALRSIYKYLISTGIYSEVKWWVTDVMVGYYSGRAEELYVAMETGVSFGFDNVFKKGNSLSIQPMVSAYMGDINYYNIGAYRNYRFLYNAATEFPNATVDQYIGVQQISINSLNRNLNSLDPDSPEYIKESERIKNSIKRKENKVNRASRLPGDLVMSELFKEREFFDFNNIGFTIPVYYYWGDFMINIGFSAFRPVNQPSYVEESWSGYSNVGISYFMSW